MMKHILAGCSLVALLSVGSLPVQAQTPAPSTKPAPTQTTVSPDELKKFASAVKQMLVVAQSTETQMSQAVQQSGLSESRFNEIYRSKKDPAAKPANQITSKEEQSYNQVVSQLVQIQKDAQTKMDKIVVAEGLQPERFNQIFAAVQSNPQLKQQVQQMLKK